MNPVLTALVGELAQLVLGYLLVARFPAMGVSILTVLGWLLLGDFAGRRWRAGALKGALGKLAFTALMVGVYLAWGPRPGLGSLIPQAWTLPVIPMTARLVPWLPTSGLLALGGVLTTLAWLAGVRAGRR
ncbi:MAG: hypothetical protein RDU89_02970 [bacterium]|nr:hypothetical protein [bacterium]